MSKNAVWIGVLQNALVRNIVTRTPSSIFYNTQYIPFKDIRAVRFSSDTDTIEIRHMVTGLEYITEIKFPYWEMHMNPDGSVLEEENLLSPRPMDCIHNTHMHDKICMNLNLYHSKVNKD
jgi:hypothetical protein